MVQSIPISVRFGAANAITVTTLRKVLTLMLSFFYFGHDWTVTHIISGSIVLGLGVYKIKGHRAAESSGGGVPSMHGGGTTGAKKTE